MSDIPQNGRTTARQNAQQGVTRRDPSANLDREDPARNTENAPPNLGRWVMPHIQTFSGLVSTIARSYKIPDEAIKDSLDNARHMRNDLSVMECLEARQRAVAGLNWHIEVDGPELPKHKALQERLTNILKRTWRFTEYRRSLLEAIWYGRQGVQHRFGFVVRGGRKDLFIKQWLPIMGDKLVFRLEDGTDDFPADQVGVRVGPMHKVGDLVGDRQVVSTDMGLGVFLAPWERNLIAVHKHMIEDAAYEDPLSSGSIHGIGIRSRIYWTWYQKQELLALFMEYLERSALGFEIWYYDDSNPNGKADMEAAAKNRVGRRNIVLFPLKPGEERSYYVEHIEPGAAGAEALQRVLSEYFGHQIKRYILGQTLTSEAAATGLGSGVAELHLQTMLDIVKYDATNLDETITHETLDQLKVLNDRDAADVDVRFVSETTTANVEEKLAAYERAYNMGAKIKEKDVMEAIDAAIPESGEPFLQIAQGRQDGSQSATATQVSVPEMKEQGDAAAVEAIKAELGDELVEPMGEGPVQFSRGGEPVRFAEFRDEDHPRDEEGKFVEGSGSQGSAQKSLFGDGIPGSPREESAQEIEADRESDYLWARESAVPNAGEDLLGSARHKRNAWRGLEDAEQSGTAEQAMNRETLLKVEPPNLLANTTPRNTLSSLAMHFCLQKFPKSAKGMGAVEKAAERFGHGKDEEAAKRYRQQYYDAYRKLKSRAEELAQTEISPFVAMGEFNSAVRKEIDDLRSGGYENRYNPVANALVETYKATKQITYGRYRANDVGAKINEFGVQLNNAYGEATPEVLEKAAEHAKDIMEGDSMNKTFGNQKEGAKRQFNPADMYVKTASRKGGRMIDAATVESGTKYMLENLGMRGVQFGNSMTDEEREHHLKRTSEAFADLADVVGLGDSEMSLGGQLGVAFGARGVGGALAHYEPGNKVINLTRKNGVGSLAHEWGHFFDHSMAGGEISSDGDRSQGDYYSGRTSAQRFVKDENGQWKTENRKMVTEDFSTDPKWQAFDQWRKSIRDSGYHQRLRSNLNELVRSGRMSKAKAQNYWSSHHETFARSFEVHVAEKLKGMGRENTYLSGLVQHGWEGAEETYAKLWPNAEEMKTISPAFENIFAAHRGDKPGASQAGAVAKATAPASKSPETKPSEPKSPTTPEHLKPQNIKATFGGTFTMTRAQWHKQRKAVDPTYSVQEVNREFKTLVTKALDAGREVHPDILRDYPDLRKYSRSLFDENDHQRDADGKFASTGGGKSGAKGEPIYDTSVKPRGADTTKTVQKKLLAGMDALPGQQDLFQTDGEEPEPEQPTPTNRKASRRTIQQAASLLKDKGYTLAGVAEYDLENKTARYKVTRPDGQTGVFTSAAINEIIDGRQPERHARLGLVVRYARWVTIGGDDGEGGTPVLIGDDGTIHAGPKSLRGKNISTLNKKPTPKKRRGERFGGAIAEEHFRNVVEREAGEWDVDADDLAETVDYVFKEREERARAREYAKQAARERTGLTQQDIARLENQGRDYTSRSMGGVTAERLKHFDAVAQELARELPDLELGDPDSDTNFAANLWDVLREGKQPLPHKYDPAIVREAAQILHLANQSGVASEGSGDWDDWGDDVAPTATDDELAAVPFSRQRRQPDLVERFAAVYRLMQTGLVQ